MISYTTSKKQGATYSDIVRIRKASERQPNQNDFIMPELGFSNQNKRDMIEIDQKPICIKEETHGEAMALPAILAAIPGIVSSALPIIKSLVASAGGASGITNLVGGLMGAAGTGMLDTMKPSSNGTQTIAPSQNGTTSPTQNHASTINRTGIDFTSPEFLALLKVALEKIPNLSTAKSQPVYSEAKVAPALAALIPMLQKVLSPEVMKSVIDSPNKLLNTIIDGTAKLDKQEMEHLEKLNPGVDDPSVERILAGMSLSLTSRSLAIPYKRYKEANLKFDLKRVTSGNIESLIFAQGQDIRIPITISVPKTLPRSIIQVILKDPETLKVHIEKKFEVDTIQPNQTIEAVTFAANELSDVPTNAALLMECRVVWKTTKGKNIGQELTTLITITSTYLYGHMGSAVGKTEPLNDINEQREFWHKVWQRDLKGETRKVTFDTKYIYQVNTKNNKNTQNQTKIKWTDQLGIGDERNVQGKLMSGFEASLSKINEVLPRLSDYPKLNPAQLEALKHEEFAKSLTFSARTQLTYRGRTGDTLALWIFPELEVREIILKKVSNTDINGQPTSFSEEAVYFGIPSSVHMIGVGSDQ